MRTKSNRNLSRKSKLLKNAKKFARPLGALLLAAVMGWGSQAAKAVDWDNSGIGSWTEATNWDPEQVPTASDAVIIDNGGTATIGATEAGLANTLTIGDDGKGVLAITDGTVTASGTISIGDYRGSTGTVTVDGVDAALKSTFFNLSTSGLYVGNNGTGTLNITGGGEVTGVINTKIGAGSSGSGTVTVDGTDSLLTNSAGYLIVGDDGKGVLNIINGGKVDSAADIYIGYASSYPLSGSTSSGTVLVGAGSELETNNGIYVGGVTVHAHYFFDDFL